MTTQVNGSTKGKRVGDLCPRCGKEGESDPDGFYCPACDSYWDIGDYRERWAELRDDDSEHYVDPESDFIENDGIFAGDEVYD